MIVLVPSHMIEDLGAKWLLVWFSVRSVGKWPVPEPEERAGLLS